MMRFQFFEPTVSGIGSKPHGLATVTQLGSLQQRLVATLPNPKGTLCCGFEGSECCGFEGSEFRSLSPPPPVIGIELRPILSRDNRRKGRFSNLRKSLNASLIGGM